MSKRHAPNTCPVCGDQLHTTRLSCDGCDTELTGHFERCEYCSLSKEDRRILSLFLSSRGNVKDVERALDVSYPTARARVDAVLDRLGYLTDNESDAQGDQLSAPSSTSSPQSSKTTSTFESSRTVSVSQSSGTASKTDNKIEMLEKLARGELSVDEALDSL